MDADFNPYEAPANLPSRPGVGKTGKRKDVRQIAVYQKGLMFCILGYLIFAALNVGLTVGGVDVPQAVRMGIGGFVLISALAGVIFVFLLSMRVYSPVLGILLSIFSIIPCIGLLILLMVSNKATGILRENGIEVGLLGADLNQIPSK